MTTKVPDPITTPVDLDAEAAAAFKAGADDAKTLSDTEAADILKPKAAPADPQANPDNDEPGDGDPIDKTLDGEDDPEAKPGDKPKEGDKPKDGEADGEPEEEGEDEPDKDIEDEIKSRNLKEDTAKRFRELSLDSKKLKEIETDIIPILTQRAQAADEFQDMLASTKATNDQFGTSLGILHLYNSGDPEKKRLAYDLVRQQADLMAKELGIDPATFDELDEHPDLKERVAKFQLERSDAMEIIENRKIKKHADRTRTEQAKTNEMTAAQADGLKAVKAMSEELTAANKDEFDRKTPYVLPAIKGIYKAFPPDQWAAEIKALYDAIPSPPKVVKTAPKAPITHQPVRPTGNRASTMVQEAKNDEEAFTMGMKATHQ